MKTLLFAAFFAYFHAAMSNSRSMADDAPVIIGSRILGGDDTDVNKVPWHVGVLFGREPTWIYSCGGSIISTDWVLSAAHCFQSGRNYSILAGSTYRDKDGSLHNIAKIIFHPNSTLNKMTPVYDIAVVKVEKPFHIDETRQPVPLYQPCEEVPIGSLGTISGWGLQADGTFSNVLKSVEVPIINMSKCFEFIGNAATNLEQYICAGGYPEGGKDSCGGDSGGPLTVNGTLVGVVSFGRGCGKPNFPSVYTNVAYFYDWIVNNTMGAITDVHAYNVSENQLI